MGTLTAAADSTSFIPSSSYLTTYVNGAFGSFTGGAVIDTNGKSVTVASSLLAPTGSGVSSLSLGSGGSGYIGAPYVEITGGGGTGATGYAVIDTNPASATYGQVTNVVLTNPGVNYTSTPHGKPHWRAGCERYRGEHYSFWHRGEHVRRPHQETVWARSP